MKNAYFEYGDIEEDKYWYESYTGYMRDADTIMQFLTPAQVEVVVETAIANGYCKDEETYTEGFFGFGNKSSTDASARSDKPQKRLVPKTIQRNPGDMVYPLTLSEL